MKPIWIWKTISLISCVFKRSTIGRVSISGCLFSVDVVGKAFLQLVEDETKNCVVLKANTIEGIREKKYKDWLYLPGAKI